MFEPFSQDTGLTRTARLRAPIAKEASMDILRTPDERFEGLDGYGFEPNYVDVDGLRIHYVDEGPAGAAPILLLHGEPTWSYLYRKMIPVLAGAGHRVVAVDFVGFGRSDKLGDREAYTYRAHLDWTRAAIEAIGLKDIILFGQDWGGLIGLRLVADDPDRFARIVAANTFLPTGDPPPPEVWFMFRDMIARVEEFDIGRSVQAGCATPLSEAVRRGYDAPFPEERFKEGARAFPQLVPAAPDAREAEGNRRAWEVLAAWEKPLLTLWGEKDAIMAGADRAFRRRVPGAAGQPHQTFDAGHFIQEDAGSELARAMVAWLAG
jgi:haloalkane dehalogenase